MKPITLDDIEALAVGAWIDFFPVELAVWWALLGRLYVTFWRR